MEARIGAQIPGDALVLQKVIRFWCTMPIKSKGSNSKDCFCPGKLAELHVYKNSDAFIKRYLNDVLNVHQKF